MIQGLNALCDTRLLLQRQTMIGIQATARKNLAVAQTPVFLDGRHSEQQHI